MTSSLTYGSGVLSGLPDNQTGLIAAANSRNGFVSVPTGHGYFGTTTEVEVPILDGAWTQVNPLLLGGIHDPDTAWTVDGNNYFVPDYAGLAGVSVPPGYEKRARLIAVIRLRKDASGADEYEGQWTENGVGVGLIEPFGYSGAGWEALTLMSSAKVDVSAGGTYGVQVRGSGTTDSLFVTSMTMSVIDALLWEAPA